MSLQPLIDFLGIKDLIPHGYCLSWSPVLLWLHVASDLLITLSYYSIPLMLVYFARKRKDLPYPWLIFMVAGFIIACGSTHLISAITIWIPIYWLDGLIKAFTAVLSVATSVLMLWVIPRALSLPSAAQLEAEIQLRKIAEDALSEKIENDRIIADRELKNSQSYTQSLVDAALDGIISIDAVGKVVAWNHQASLIFGYSSEQVLGRELAELIVPVIHREAHRQGIARFIKTGISSVINTRIEIIGMRADSSEFPLELTITALKQHGSFFFSAYVRDISDRKQAETALQLSEDRFKTIFNEAPLGIALVDSVTGRFIAVNAMHAKIAGKTVDEMLEIDWMEITHPDDVQKDLDNMALLNAGKISEFKMEKRYLRTDGSVVWINMMIAPVVVENKAHPCHLAMIEDITERKQIEKELHIAATAFESQEAMFITDASQAILKVNKAFTRITGYSPEEAIGKTPVMLKSDQQDKQFYKVMWKSLNCEKFWQGELWNRRKNGELYPEWLSISSVIDASGQVTNYVASFTDVTTIKKSEETIHNLAFHDPLTGLPNRRLLIERLQVAMNASTRLLDHGAVLFIDLDNFKELNDIRGHSIGDLLLIETAKRLQGCVRSIDTVACLGGDDFVVVLVELNNEPEQAAIQAESVAEKIRIVLSQPFDLQGLNYCNVSSIGISLFRNFDISIEDLLKQADTAMYQAKKSGRNTIRFFDSSTHAAMEARIALEADLRLALPGKQFHLHYQMQVDNTGKILGAEALIRWLHPERGLVPPGQFIPITEENGLIVLIGQWVLETACTQIKQWESAPHTQHLQLAVNVSALQFRQADFVEQVCGVLKKTAINPRRLKLELTESLVLEDVNDTIAKIQTLKELGMYFSMDDFGTGYSSLAYLSKLPLDQLKIDQSFVYNIGIKSSDTVIVQTIIGMAKNLDMEVIAEGVETEQQREFLELNGCTNYQGYLFSKPVPIEQFEQLLKSPIQMI